VFIEAGARVENCLLNASTGPIYVGRNAEIMEGAMVRGPFALCEGAVVKMGATIYGATTIGPYAVVGGEIKNCVIGAFSNKAHHGYLGDSVIGQWCNLGAGTSNSNIKNNASTVRVWSHHRQAFLPGGLKCGLFMGDYSKCAINTSFNTGTVTGICCNIFGETKPPKFIPNFSWGHAEEGSYALEKALDDISKWKKLKNRILTEEEKQSLEHIFAHS
jgi:UDP-N-acetylglucosamine diphosphorylase/glucosamine-1-phosphate N-acetyltransferase